MSEDSAKARCKLHQCSALMKKDTRCTAYTPKIHSWCRLHAKKFVRLVSAYKKAESDMLCDPYMVICGFSSLDTVSTGDLPMEFNRCYTAYIIRSKVNQMGFVEPDQGHLYRCNILLDYLFALDDEMSKRKDIPEEIEITTYEFVETYKDVTLIPRKHVKTVDNSQDIIPPLQLDIDALYWKVTYETAVARIKTIANKMDTKLFCTALTLHIQLYCKGICEPCVEEKGITITTMSVDEILKEMRHVSLLRLQHIHICLNNIEMEFNVNTTLLDLQKQGLHYINNYIVGGNIPKGLICVTPTDFAHSQIKQAYLLDNYLKSVYTGTRIMDGVPGVDENFALYTGLKKGYKKLVIKDIEFRELDRNSPVIKRYMEYHSDEKNNETIRENIKNDETCDIYKRMIDNECVRVLSGYETLASTEEYIRVYLRAIKKISYCIPSVLLSINLDEISIQKDIKINKKKLRAAILEDLDRHLCKVVIYPDRINKASMESAVQKLGQDKYLAILERSSEQPV